MKKLLLFLSFLLMSIGVFGTISTLTFTSACEGSGTSDNGVSWTIISDGVESNFDNTKGIHYGTNKAQVQYIRLSANGVSGVITKIIVNASTASDVSATVSVTVGGDTFGGEAQSLTTSAANYTFNGNASGEIIVTITKPSKAAKALYCKSIEVTYSESSLSTYTVTYDTNGGTGEIIDSNSPYNGGVTVTTLVNTFTKDGYSFTGWNTAANGGGIDYAEGTTFTINMNTTLYAQWEEIVVPPIPVECNGNFYDFSLIDGFSDWGTGYGEKILIYTDDSIILSSANRQTQTITDIPVTKGSAIIVKGRNNKKFSSINLVCRQWVNKEQTIELWYSTDGGETFNTTGVVSNNFTLYYNEFNPNTNAIKFTFSSSSNQIGIENLCVNHDICLPSISVTKIEQGGTFDLSSDSVCENGSVTLSNIMPSEGYKFDTIICLAQDGEEFVEHGTVNVSDSTISGITKDCYVVVIFSQLPPKPEIEIVEWHPDYIKVDIDNFDAVTAVIENKNTQLNVENTATELFFSKYFEAAGNNKMIAIYNGTTDTLDLSKYYISKAEAMPTVLELGQFGRLSGYILPSEEIIFARFDNKTSAKPCADTLDGFNNWVQYTEGDKSAPAGFHDTMTFGGRASLGLYKKGLGVDTLIDVIGSHNNGTLMRIGKSGESTCQYAKITEYNDDAGYYTYSGDSVHGNSDDYFLSTNRCLLIRKNTVHSGDTAVKYNIYDTFDDCCTGIAESFVTLSSEWMGFRIGTGSSSSGEINSLTCTCLSELGKYDYGNYYAQYTQVGEKIILGKTEPDGSYKIDINNLDTLSCTYLKVIVNDNSNNSEECEYKIPIFVTENTVSNSLLFYQEGADCPDCNVVIINGGKLTVNSNLENRDVTVYPGGVLIIPSDQTYKVNSLTLRRDNDSIPYFSYKGTLNTNKFNIDLRTDAEDWRWMTLPFAIHTDSIKLSNGKPINLNNNVWISYYDGKHRSIYQKNAWKDIYKDTVFNAGEGFLFGVDLPGQSKKIYRFSFNKEDSIEHEKSDKIIRNLYAWGGDNPNLAPNHKGWNLIGNPFMDSITSDIKDPIRIGRLKRDSVNG